MEPARAAGTPLGTSGTSVVGREFEEMYDSLGKYEFNEKFQLLTEQLRKVTMRTMSKGRKERLELCLKLIQLHDDFLDTAITYGRLIISKRERERESASI